MSQSINEAQAAQAVEAQTEPKLSRRELTPVSPLRSWDAVNCSGPPLPKRPCFGVAMERPCFAPQDTSQHRFSINSTLEPPSNFEENAHTVYVKVYLCTREMLTDISEKQSDELGRDESNEGGGWFFLIFYASRCGEGGDEAASPQHPTSPGPAPIPRGERQHEQRERWRSKEPERSLPPVRAGPWKAGVGGGRAAGTFCCLGTGEAKQRSRGGKHG